MQGERSSVPAVVMPAEFQWSSQLTDYFSLQALQWAGGAAVPCAGRGNFRAGLCPGGAAGGTACILELISPFCLGVRAVPGQTLPKLYLPLV